MATCQKRGNSYKITVSCGYDINNKQIRPSMTWTPDPKLSEKQVEKELERQKVLFEERCHNGQSVTGSIKFTDFIDLWLETYAKKQLRPKTIDQYTALIPRIKESLGHLRIDRIQPNNLLNFYNELSKPEARKDMKYKACVDFKALLKERGITKKECAEKAGIGISVLDSACKNINISSVGAKAICSFLNLSINKAFAPAEIKPLSNKTIMHYREIISTVLSAAVQWQAIPSNPSVRIRPPKQGKYSVECLDEIEAAKMLDTLAEESVQYRTMIQTLLFTGMRRGELLGLEWQDIDFDNKMIHICRSSLYSPVLGIFEDGTKTDNSARTIKVADIVIDILKDYRRWQLEYRLKIGDQWHSTNRLFTKWNGEPFCPDVLTSWFKKFLKRNNLPDVTLHSLRHTNATLLIASGVPITTVSNRLGHTNTTTTTKIYAHAIRSADEAAAETLQNILAPSVNRKKAT